MKKFICISFVGLIAFTILSLTRLNAQYNWYQLNDYGGNARYGAVSFVIGQYAYVGLGKDASNYFTDFWKYDPTTDSWSKIADFGGTGRSFAVSFVVNNKAYVTTGENASTRFKDLWEYDPTSNNWTKKADFAGTARSRAVSFSMNNIGYVTTGYDGTEKKDLWQYDVTSNTWTQKADLASDARQSATGFALNGKGYICAGISYASGTFVTNDIYEYNPTTNSWAEKSFAESHLARTGAASFVMNNKAYICGGSGKKDLWEYNATTNSWNQLADFGLSSESNRESACGFAINNKGYITTGEYFQNISTAIIKKDCWTYSPPLPPKAPSNLVANNFQSNYFQLNWIDNANDETFQIIECSIGNNQNYVRYDSIGANSTYAIIMNTTDTTTYFLRIKAGNSGGYSAYSSELAVTTRFASPDYFIVAPVSKHSAELMWRINSTKTNKFFIEKSVNDNLHYTLVDSITSVSNPTWSDTILTEGTKYFYRVYTKYLGKKIYSNENFAIPYEQGSWTQITDFPQYTSNGSFSFTIGNKIYVGISPSSSDVGTISFREYDIDKKTWSTKTAYPGTGVYDLTACSINGKGYVGLGRVTMYVNSQKCKDFWEYNPENDSWTQKNNFAGQERFQAPSVVIGNKIYVGMGNNNTSNFSDLWEYDPTNNAWTQKANCPVYISYPTSFCLNNKGYFAAGAGMDVLLYSYDPSNNQWTKKNDFTDWKYENKNSAQTDAFTVGNKAYMLLRTLNSFWEYDEVNDKWIRKNGFSNSIWLMGYSKGLSAGTTNYGFYHINTEGTVPNSGGGSYKFFQYNPNGPANPNNLKVTSYSTKSVSLKWNDNSSTETKFIIERRLGYLAWSVLDSTNANITNYKDTTASANSTYFYQVMAKNSIDKSGYSNEVYAKTGTPYVGTFNSIISKYNEKNVYIDYNGQKFTTYDGADGFYLERSDELNPNYIVIDTIPAPFYTYTDPNMVPGRWYSYRLRAYNNCGVSAYNSVVKILVGSASIYTGTLYSDQLTLLDNAGYNSEYKHCSDETLTLYPQTSGNKIAANIKEIGLYNTDSVYFYNGPSKTSPLLAKLTGNEIPTGPYYGDNSTGALTIRFKANCSWSSVNNGFLIEVNSYKYFPPSVLIASPELSKNINLSWKDNTSNENYFIIERSVDDKLHFVKIDSIGTNIIAYTDTAALSNHIYYYRIKAKIGAEYSDYSNLVLTQLLPEKPTGLKVSFKDDSKVTLKWEDKSDNEDDFILSRSQSDSLHFLNTDTIAANTSSFIKSVPQRNYIYYYKLTALNKGGKSLPTSAVPYVILNKPNYVSSNSNLNRITINWVDYYSIAERYIIERSEQDTLHFVVIDSLLSQHISNCSYIDYSIKNAVKYYYRIKAYHTYGESLYSGQTNQTALSNAIDDIKDDAGFNLFPNPVSQELNIQINSSKTKGIIDLKILDLNGKIVKSIEKGNITGNEVKINVSELTKGIYYLQINDQNKYYTKKFIIQ